MKLLKWFTGLGIFGLAMIIVGAIAPRDGLAIAGGVVLGSVAISVAILASPKN